jgi:hypothetical protein
VTTAKPAAPEEPAESQPRKPAEELDVEAVFAKLKQIGGGKTE